MPTDQKKRIPRKIHLAKTISWRIIATFTTFLLAWILTGNFEVSLAIGGFEAITKMIFYYFHERAWMRLELKYETQETKN